MTSPLRRRAEQLAADRSLPADNWLARRVAAIEGHRPSVEAAQRALLTLGSVILNGNISTDILVESNPDPKNTRPSEDIGYLTCSVIPSIQGLRPHIPAGLGYSWTPDVALQLACVFKDRYVSGPGKLQPTGDVALHVSCKTWGTVTPQEIVEVGEIGHNTWAERGDMGHSRNGSRVLAIRQPGELISNEDAEAMIAPLAEHVLQYFDLVGRPDLVEYQTPGNFTSHLAPKVTITRDYPPHSGPHELPR